VTRDRAAWALAGVAALVVAALWLLVFLTPPVVDPDVEVPDTAPAVCAPVADTYAGDGDPGGAPCPPGDPAYG
jgi:hypothetical protein